MNDGDTGLYYYNARYYEPGLARFVQADTIVPDPNNPQLFNRYSYVGNSPLNYVDPSGHDLMIVTGVGDQWIGDIEPWKAWIMAYKGMSLEDWNAFTKEWDLARKEGKLELDGIKFFDWTACDCAWGNADNSFNATIEQALPLLIKQLQGMQDITILGFSKGANLAAHYANSKNARGNADLRNIISLQTPQTSGLYPFFARTSYIDEVDPDSNLINVFNTEDPINDGQDGAITNALNVSFTESAPNDHTVEFLGNGRLAPFIFYRVTNIVGHANASNNVVPIPTKQRR